MEVTSWPCGAHTLPVTIEFSTDRFHIAGLDSALSLAVSPLDFRHPRTSKPVPLTSRNDLEFRYVSLFVLVGPLIHCWNIRGQWNGRASGPNSDPSRSQMYLTYL